ncbi:Innexin [Teladorsagia circumcincta]|uniref:Innexin n=1 Tax=Teladorsagia circumcincta TaxID=45464 RepID=A0A2G9V402_TELCI|nr:Innexin [Teladorsagia circumcincta]
MVETKPYGRGGVVGAARSDMFFHATLARSFINALSLCGDDDVIDRLNYYYTPIMLCIACLIISAKQYGGTPIECWVNPHSRESMEEYIESYCWIQNTYWVPMYENIPDDHTAREGLNIQHLINAACDTQAVVDPSERQKAIDALASCFVDNLDLQSPNGELQLRSMMGRLKCKRLLAGHYVSTLYLFTKLFYTLNIVVQFMILNACLKSDEYLFFGFQVLQDLMNGKPWTESGHFPRVTLCDFEVRYLANLNSISTLCWMINSLVPSEKIDYVLKFMQIAQSSDMKKRLKFFKVFILRMMANHAGDIVVVHVLRALWQEFRERNWREFEEFEELKDQHFRHLPKAAMVVGTPSNQQARVVTISNPVSTIMNDSMNSEKGYL